MNHSACGNLSFLSGGGNRRSFRAGWEWGQPDPKLIGITIRALLHVTIAVGDIEHGAPFGLNCKVAAGFDGHTPDMHSPSGSLWHHGTNHVARLVAEVALASLAMGDGDAHLVGLAHLAMTSTGRHDQQGNHLVGGKL